MASAALVASQLPGGEPVNWLHGPQEPVPPLPADLRELAATALATLHISSSRAESWFEKADRDRWHAQIRQLHEVLTAAPSQPSLRTNPAPQPGRVPLRPPVPPAAPRRH